MQLGAGDVLAFLDALTGGGTVEFLDEVGLGGSFYAPQKKSVGISCEEILLVSTYLHSVEGRVI